MLTCHQLACERQGVPVFSGLGFSLLGEAAMLVAGANGSGKTSLLKTVAGLLRPDSGGVTWRGVPIRRPEDYRGEALYLGHRDAVKEEESVFYNVAFWARMRGEPMLVPAALRYFGLERWADTPCWRLSAGWKRRVALARLIVIPALLWLLDEPAAHLDDEGVALLGGLIESRTQKSGIVIMATHGLERASAAPPAGNISILRMEHFRAGN